MGLRWRQENLLPLGQVVVVGEREEGPVGPLVGMEGGSTAEVRG